MRLRVGVIGLGRRWRRYRPLLTRLSDHVEVRAVCDHVARRAESEARQLRCAAAAGPVELLQRRDVEALLLLDAQWFGSYALDRACQTDKPIYCALAPRPDDPHADALHQQIQGRTAPVFLASSILLAPATMYLRELMTHRLGQARLVRVEWSLKRAANRPPRDLLSSSVLLPVLSACGWLLDDSPRSAWAIDGEGASFLTIVLRFGSDRLAQVTLWSATAGCTPGRFEVITEAGSATAELPRQLRWRDADGEHAQRLPRRSAAQSGLERFILGVRSGQPLRPSFADAYQALTWLRAAERSRAEGQRIALS